METEQMVLSVTMRGRLALTAMIRSHFQRPENQLQLDDANLSCASEILLKIKVSTPELNKLKSRNELGQVEITDDAIDSTEPKSIELDGTQAEYLRTFLKNVKGTPEDRIWFKPLVEQMDSPASKRSAGKVASM